MPNQHALSMVEVLIALMVLALGLLAFAKAQIALQRSYQCTLYENLAWIRLLSLRHEAHLQPMHWQKLLHPWQQVNSYLLPQAKYQLHLQKSKNVTLFWHAVCQHQQKSLSIHVP